MNFEDIKRKMDSENMDDNQLPTKIEDIKTSNMPIQKVRKSMRIEIYAQLVLIVIFFAIPSFIEMYQLPKVIYYILMLTTTLITLIYLGKMSWFLNKSSDLSSSSKDAVLSFIYDLKLTLEVYKTAIISGSLLLPLSMISLYLGRLNMNEELFENLILLNVSNTTIFLYVFGYLVVSILIYLITVMWSNKLYGVHIKNLEKILKELNS